MSSPAQRYEPVSVSVIVPIYNEELYIRACAENLLEQTYPAHLVTLLLVDGRSEDATRQVIQQLQADYPERDIRLLDNPKRGVAAALNIGIQAAQDEVIVRMDAHSIPQADFIEASVRALQTSGAAYAGGLMVPEGRTPFGKAVGHALSHRLGAGGAKFHTATEAQYTDTVYLGAFRKSVFDEVGLFDEDMAVNEDYELNTRVRKSGGKIYLEPYIQTIYTPRDTPGRLWTQYFKYGWWRVETLRKHPDSLRPRQLLPTLFVSICLILLVLSLFTVLAQYALGLALLFYAALLVFVTVDVYRQGTRDAATLLCIPVAVTLMHFSYGLGFICNVVSGGRFPYHAKRSWQKLG